MEKIEKRVKIPFSEIVELAQLQESVVTRIEKSQLIYWKKVTVLKGCS